MTRLDGRSQVRRVAGSRGRGDGPFKTCDGEYCTLRRTWLIDDGVVFAHERAAGVLERKLLGERVGRAGHSADPGGHLVAHGGHDPPRPGMDSLDRPLSDP